MHTNRCKCILLYILYCKVCVKMKSFSILGGDLRFSVLYELLKKEGFEAKIYGNGFSSENTENIRECIENTEITIGSIPSFKELKLNMSYDINADELFDMMKQLNVKQFVGGVISDKIRIKALEYDIEIHDFFESEYVAVMNAIPTAEGAIQIAIEQSKKTIFASKAIVTGYGRCAKAICRILKAMNSVCYATYRNPDTLAQIISDGILPVHISKISEYLNDADFVFNTVPAMIFTENLLSNLNKDCITVDIAQAPGGVDYNFARMSGIKALYCPGLPGRTAPHTAAAILKNALIDMI